MAIASITQWLSGPRNFAQGRELYEQYGDDPVVLTIIRTGTGSFHLAKLVEALQVVNLRSNLQPKPIEVGDIVNTPSQKSSPDLKGASDELWKIRAEKNLAYARARRLYEAIRVNDSRTYRLEAAMKLLNEMDDVNEAWAVIDDWEKTGKVWEVKERQQCASVATMTVPDLLREEKNLRTYISKDKKKLDTATDAATRMKIAQRMDERWAKLEEIRRRIESI